MLVIYLQSGVAKRSALVIGPFNGPQVPRGPTTLSREARKGQREKREQEKREIRILVLVTRYKYLGASLYVCT